MRIKKVNILCKHDRNFQDIALLVDREDFLKDILVIRKRLEATDIRLPKSTREEFYNNCNLVDEARHLCNKYQYPSTYVFAIINIIKTNLIKDGDLKDCYGKVEITHWYIDNKLPYFYPRKDEIIIRLSVNQRAIKNSLRKSILKQIKQIYPLIRQVQSKKNHPLLLDVKPEIRKSRNWYWKNKAGLSAEKIASKYSVNGTPKKYGYSLKNIEATITSYKKLLNLSINTVTP